MDNTQAQNRLRSFIRMWRDRPATVQPLRTDFLPQNFASHHENVMQEVVVRNMNDTVNYLITISTIDQNVNTLTEIRTEYYKLHPESSTYMYIPIDYIPTVFCLGTLGLFMGLQYLTEWNAGISAFSLIATVLMYIRGKSIQQSKNGTLAHLIRMYNSLGPPPFTGDFGTIIQYNTLMNLLWGWIRRHPHRAELVRRLFEEVGDSINVCHHGNMTRLANIMQGFCTGLYILNADAMQTELARISRSTTATLEEKLHEAGELFDKFGYGAAERAPWLAAIHDDNN